MPELYERQPRYPEIHNKNYLIIGCGGVGYWSAKFLAMSGMAQTITLIDGDRWERSNLNRVDLPENVIGKPKVNVTKEKINSLRPSVSVVAIDRMLDESFFDDYDFDFNLHGIVMAADSSPEIEEIVEDKFAYYLESKRICYIAAEDGEIEIRLKPIKWSAGEANYDNIWAGTVAYSGMQVVNFFQRRLHNTGSRMRHFDNVKVSGYSDLFDSIADKNQSIIAAQDELQEQIQENNEEITRLESKVEQLNQTKIPMVVNENQFEYGRIYNEYIS